MEVSTKGAGPIWKVVFLSILGLAAVGGMMYMLFTDESYNGYGGKNSSEDVIVSTDASKADSIAKAAHAKADSQKAFEAKTAASKDETAKSMESSVPVAKPVEQPKPQAVPASKPVAAAVVTPKPAVVTSTPVVKAPAPASLVAKTTPPPAKPAVPVKTQPTVAAKPMVTVPKPQPAPPKAATTPVVKSTPASSTTTAHTAATPASKTLVKKEDKVMSNDELQKMVSDVLARGNEAGIYAKCVQLRNTADGNNTSTMKQIESYFRSQKFVIAGRETVSTHVKGYTVAAGDGCMKLTVGSF